jgi:hypothetical protein
LTFLSSGGIPTFVAEAEMRNDERRKLTASWLNILAASVISSGSVAQLIIEASGDHGRATVGRTLITAVICLAVGLARAE